MTRAYDPTRKALTQIVGVALMIWGVGWALAWVVATVFFVGLAVSQGWTLPAVAGVVGGLVMAGFGAGKAMAGWILAKPPRPLL